MKPTKTEWSKWNADVRMTYNERFAICIEGGMDEDSSRRTAVIEARREYLGLTDAPRDGNIDSLMATFDTLERLENE